MLEKSVSASQEKEAKLKRIIAHVQAERRLVSTKLVMTMAQRNAYMNELRREGKCGDPARRGVLDEELRRAQQGAEHVSGGERQRDAAAGGDNAKLARCGEGAAMPVVRLLSCSRRRESVVSGMSDSTLEVQRSALIKYAKSLEERIMKNEL